MQTGSRVLSPKGHGRRGQSRRHNHTIRRQRDGEWLGTELRTDLSEQLDYSSEREQSIMWVALGDQQWSISQRQEVK